MLTFQQVFLMSGALFGFLGVSAGAFGAHVLKSKLAVSQLEIFEVAVRYQMYHALILVGVSLLLSVYSSVWFNVAGWAFLVGTLIFSGSLYLLVYTGIKWWGAITPIGGVFLVLGWLSILIGAFFHRSF